MQDSKKLLLYGKLTGTKTLTSELKSKQNLDEIEQFLLDFSKLKLDLYSNSEIKYINDDQELLDSLENIYNNNFISIFHTENFSKLYITTDSKITYVIRSNKISSALIGTFISNENIVKLSINSFHLIKWCNNNNIEIKNLYDIPTYIKLLTNDVNPLESTENYVTKYTNYVFDSLDIEKNYTITSNFIYIFGTYLDKYIKKFDLETINKLINENSYFEGNSFKFDSNSSILLEYTNISNAIETIISSVTQNLHDKKYFISPLNRIVPIFNKNISNLVYDIYLEDLSITILNELYNHNIKAKLLDRYNSFFIPCESENVISIFTLIKNIFTEAFFNIFENTPELHIEINIK